MNSAIADIIRNGTVCTHNVTAVAIFLDQLVYKLANLFLASAIDQGLRVIIKTTQHTLAREELTSFFNGHTLREGCPVVSLCLVILIPA